MLFGRSILTRLRWFSARTGPPSTPPSAADRAQADLKRSSVFLDSIISNLPDMVFVKDLRTNQFVLFNRAGEQLLGMSHEELQRKAATGMLPRDLAELLFTSDNESRLESMTNPRDEFAIETRDHGLRILQTKRLIINGVDAGKLSGTDQLPEGQYLLAISEDVTERRSAEQRLVQEATHDALTQLPNRQHFLERLTRCLEAYRADRSKHFGVLFLDLDQFKLVNDSLGHAVGDLLLLDTARKLMNCVKMLNPSQEQLHELPIVARLGGDEFTILIENLSTPADAQKLAQAIHESLRLPFTFPGREVFVTASIGITTSHNNYEQSEDVLRDADTAMYRAKAGGRNRWEMFDLSMHESAILRLNTEHDLRRSIAEHGFVLHYQPIVNLATQQISGIEALVRWKHPGRGFVSPIEFIEIAEETGLIIPIGAWVLREACDQLQRWRRRTGLDLTMSVNLSRKQFGDAQLLQTIDAALEQSGIPADRLNLEITETMIMEFSPAVSETVAAIHARGINLHLDDFGTGYSSLSCLHRFPINGLKIDREFISELSDNPDYIAVVQAIITLAHKLRSRVVAEGIETARQQQMLTNLGCDFAQGFHLHRPMEVEAINLILEHRKSSAA